MRGHRHDRARAVGDKNIIGDKNWNFRIVDRVYRTHALDANAGFILVNLCALEVGFAGRLCLIGPHFIQVFNFVRPFFDQRMLRGKHHIGSAEERIRPGGINSHLIARCGGKINLRAGGATDPVALLYLDTVDKIKLVQIVEQSLGIGRNF